MKMQIEQYPYSVRVVECDPTDILVPTTTKLVVELDEETTREIATQRCREFIAATLNTPRGSYFTNNW